MFQAFNKNGHAIIQKRQISQFEPFEKPFFLVVYGHIYPCRWIKITLSLKLLDKGFQLKLYVYA